MASVNLQEKANFTRLSSLLVDKGTEALRNTLDTKHPPANLPAVLNANRISLLKLKPRVINDHQWDLLFPPSGNPPDSKTFDVTLLTVLLRNICGLSPPATGWNKMPPYTDNSLEANATRIKLFRNQVYAHVASTQVDKATFDNLWQKVSKVLVDLNIPQNEIDDLKTCSLGPEEEIYVQTLKEWFLKEEDCKNMVVDVQQHLYNSSLQQQDDTETLKSSMQHLTQITEENRQGIQQLCEFSSRQSGSERPKCDSEGRKDREKHNNSVELQPFQELAKHNFKSKIRNKAKLFHPGTRHWLLKKVENWFTTEDESRLLLVTAGPGFGKSVFAAKICELFRGKGKLAASHFCDFNDSNLKDPMMMLQSIASHMCENVPGFREKLLDQLSRPHKVHSLKDAFQVCLQNPLDELQVEEPRLIVIDGLDESATDDKRDMVKLISDHFPDLPKCVKVLITSRPALYLGALLSHAKTITIDASNKDNGLDILEYLKVCLPSLAARVEINPLKQAHLSDVLPAIVEKCEGSFLYAFHVQHELCKRGNLDTITLEELISFLPEGMGSIYQEYFHRLEMELETVMNKNPDLFKLLEILVAIEKPLPLKFIARTLDLDLDCRETKRIINKVNEVVSCLLYVLDDLVTVFHKSVYDWLLANGYDDHEYTVKVGDGKKRLWLLCEQVFEEIRRNVTLGHDLKLTNDVTHALEHGHEYLLACNMQDSFSWLVDMVIVHVLSTVHPKTTHYLLNMLEEVLRSDVAISPELRQRISWHLTEIRYRENHVVFKIRSRMKSGSRFSYVEAVLDHSPEGCFTDSDKKIAEELLAKVPRCVKRNSVGVTSMNLLSAKLFRSSIVVAVGVSSSKKLAAVALSDGTICVLSLPDLVEIWQCSTENHNIPCCTFAPDDSFVLYGKLETALNIAEKKEALFFHKEVGKFKSCSFSPNGKRLVTNDCSNTIKLWDVVRQCVLTVLCAGNRLDFCRFSNTGLFIIGDQKVSRNHPYCVWNSITFQRVDQRSLFSGKLKRKDGVLRSKRCNRCFRQERKELIPSKEFHGILATQRSLYWNLLQLDEVFTGIYHGVDCIFYSYNQSLHVIESTHFTTLVAWQISVAMFNDHRHKKVVDITAIKDDLWLYGDQEKLIVFSTAPPKENQLSLSRVLWCSFSPDGTRLATCTSDGLVKLWNVELCQIYQRFRSNAGTSLAACWWSDKYLFVFHLIYKIPNLSRYPVDENLNIMIAQRQLVSLYPLVNEFSQFSEIQDFSEGYLIFEYSFQEPVKILDVNRIGDPQFVILPGIVQERYSRMRITVSPGATFLLGISSGCYGSSRLFLWKRSEDNPAWYKEHVVCDLERMFVRECCISNDSKYALCNSCEVCVIIDMNTGVSFLRFRLENPPDVLHGAPKFKVFCTNTVVIRVIPNLIQIYNLKSGEGIGSSFQRNLTEYLYVRSKLSPKGTILAVPRLTGNMEFLQLCIPECSSLWGGLENKKRTGDIKTPDGGIVSFDKKRKVE